MKNNSVLVIFGKDLPKKSKKWWRQINTVVGPRSLKEEIEKDRGLFFVDIEELVGSGSVQEACELVDKLPHLTLPDGRTLPKLVDYHGYELWWVHYDNLMAKFCLPYTQYRSLLMYLRDFPEISFFQAPHPDLFEYFLDSHNRKCLFLKKPRKLFPIPLGILIQVIFSSIFLLWLKITRPKLMVWTSDQFDHPHDYDFRMRFIYEELRKRKLPFVEFIRSQEHLPIVLKHAWQRKRPVVYSAAIISFLRSFARWFEKKRVGQLVNLCLSPKLCPEEHFWFLVATHYLRNSTGTIWAIRVMRFILRWIGVQSAIVPSGCSRTFHEILACKLIGIKTIGIQHGVSPRYLSVYEFMPGFSGKLPLTPDMYGLWSEWWRKYFLSHSRAFKPEQLYVSGPMRPLEKEVALISSPRKEEPIRVLFVSEQLAVSSEVLPYLLALLEAKDFSFYLKFRPYRDGFEEWLRQNQPATLEKVKILKGSMHDAIAQSDVVVGSHSTGVLEALLQFKPFVFFRTKKWGDYLEIKSLDSQGRFFAEDPGELINCVRKGVDISKEDLESLQNRFFGDPYQNGSKWVVEQALKFL